jgi:hypothetical protein
MKYLLPLAAMACTGGATLLMLGFLLAGAANASADQLRSMKLWAGGLGLLALVCVIAGILLMRQGRSGHAAVVAFAPTVVMGLILLVAVWT